MSRQITKKVLPEYFQDIIDGKKKYELRLNDFDVEPGDILVLEEYTSTDPQTRQATGRKLEKQVTYVRKFKLEDLWWSKEDIEEKGVQIISFE
jgi:ASC-1-like (ASCH) protein